MGIILVICSVNALSLSDIKSLENWDVSNGYNFSFIFFWMFIIIRYKSIKNLEYIKWE